MISVQVSGSTFSAATVEPFTSQNNMVMTRRSPTITSWARAASIFTINSGGINLSSDWVIGRILWVSPALTRLVIPSDVPQCMQNFASSGLLFWQLGQFTEISDNVCLILAYLILIHKYGSSSTHS